MAAPILRNYRGAVSTANTPINPGGLVPAGRAIVVSKLVITGPGSSFATISLGISNAAGNYNLAASIIVNAGEVYTESGLIILAGDGVWMTSSVTGPVCNYFGEEVDN